MAASSDYYLGRQPVLDRKGELVGYECLFRSSLENRAIVIDDVTASAAVIKHAFFELGIETVIGDKTGFINISEELLMNDVIEFLPPHSIVLELLESTKFTPGVINRLTELRAVGYRIALDDVTAYTDQLHHILPLIDIIKIDIFNMSPEAIESLAGSIRPRVKTMLAEKVETAEQFEHCRALGFKLFQGYFFAKPSILTGSAIQPAELMLIKLFAALTRGADIEVLVDILKRVPDFTLRLMTLANAPERRRLHKVTTLNQAIIALGMLNIRRLVKIVLFAGTSETSIGNNPLLQTVVLRGRLMELVAEICGSPEVRRDAFLVGLLSLADALFKQPLADVLTAIHAEKSWVAALLHRQGTLGQLLTMAEAAERADDEQLRHTLETLGMPSLQRFAYLQADALRWASDF